MRELKRINDHEFLILQAVFEHTPAAVFVKDVKDDFRVILWNRAAEDIFGIKKTEIIGRCAHDLWPKEQADLYLLADQKVAADGQSISVEEPSFSKTRGNLTIHTQKLPLRLGNENEVLYLLCICEDITETKRVIEDQKTLSNLLKEAQSVAKIGSWSFDLKTQYLTWSSENYKIFEFDEPQPKDSLFQMYRQRIHPEDILQLDYLLERIQKYGEGFVYNHRLVLPDGRIKYIQGIGNAVLDEKKNPIRASGTCHDITDRVINEKALALERAKSLQASKLASLGEMSAGIAHEINNPLAVIVAAAAQMEKNRENVEKFNEKIQLLQRSAHRIEKIVTGLRKFARVEGSHIRDPILISDLIREAVLLTETRATREGVKIELDLTSNPTIIGDAVEIEQALVNMINNAIDAVKSSPQRWVKCTLGEDDQSVFIKIKDAGQGVPEAIAIKLFQPFFTTKAPHEGTGLGLSIAKGILDEHHATLRYLLDEGHTCFEIKFSKTKHNLTGKP